ncbi:MAG: FumA C-terminus/TtdB family hydratase beta subunit [Bacilli bacterium]|nr:FumA C-terminus/TtdB family hydratase beta subunit [Bacilli bacterium]
MIDITKLHAGDVIYLDEIVYTARDQAHARLASLLDEGKELPVDFSNSFIYYAGPTPTMPNGRIGSIGPTTSSRMDKFIEYMPALKIKGMIGKGPRDEHVRECCKKYGIVYLVATGGAGALLAKRIKSVQEVAFQDLGCEAIRKLEVEHFPVIVAYDIYGNSVFEK